MRGSPHMPSALEIRGAQSRRNNFSSLVESFLSSLRSSRPRDRRGEISESSPATVYKPSSGGKISARLVMMPTQAVTDAGVRFCHSVLATMAERLDSSIALAVAEVFDRSALYTYPPFSWIRWYSVRNASGVRFENGPFAVSFCVPFGRFAATKFSGLC